MVYSALKHGETLTTHDLPDVRLLSASDRPYPRAFKDLFGGLAAPDLWCMGNFDLIEKRSVGFCGSRNASEQGLAAAADCSKQLSEANVVVISGYAAGVDMASHESALANSGETIIILAEGIDHFRIKKTIKSLWDWSRVLVLSHFPRNAVWRADRAMERNRAIVALSDAVIVIEARDTGGTLNAGFRALEMKKPLFVALYEDLSGDRGGNAILIEQGGMPLQRSSQTQKANLRKLFAVVNEGDLSER
jgi:DNA processing protein